MSGERLKCFKTYDIRGRTPDDLDPDLAFRIGRAYAAEIRPDGPVVVGRDIRLSSPELAAATIRGLNQSGVDTYDIGVCGTEMVYFAAARPGMGGGVMVTASHNPLEYNGMKFVRGGATPISGDSGLDGIERRARLKRFGPRAVHPGSNRSEDVLEAYVGELLTFVSGVELEPFRIVANPGNGGAGPVLERLSRSLPFEFIPVNFEPDGHFPNGVPNPLLPENRPVTTEAVRRNRADLGIAWDGDFDRCFFFDEHGDFVDGYYMVGLLARRLLEGRPGERIVHDPRMTWNTLELVREAGGVPVQSRTGHVFMKQKMREVNGLYGGEMSAHHYFREFAFCDSGMIPWLLLTALLSESGRTLSELVVERKKRYPGSGEINSTVPDPDRIIGEIKARFQAWATAVDETDGLSLEFGDRWRFNVRKSMTEPVVRLNVETRADPNLLRCKTEELLALIRRG
ncbi:MAG: phosphomannomutase [Kiritimatiellaeota bacterium]|nr:phosphomannomutase [Kiritimatiellota bacterium]